MIDKIIIRIIIILTLISNTFNPVPKPEVTFLQPEQEKVSIKKPNKQVVKGRATWYNVGRGYYAAAGPSLRIGNWRGRVVTVCNDSGCLKVKLTDWCACFVKTPRERAIDLSADAFAALYPLSKGVGFVTIKW